MERIKILIKGIQRDVSPAMAPMGSCQDMVNLRVHDGALRPIKPKKVLFQATAGVFVPPPEPGAEDVTTFVLTIYTVGDGDVYVNGSLYTAPLTFPEDTEITLSAVTASGYTFVGFSGDASSMLNPVTFTLDADKAVTASFQETVVEYGNYTVQVNMTSPNMGWFVGDVVLKKASDDSVVQTHNIANTVQSENVQFLNVPGGESYYVDMSGIAVYDTQFGSLAANTWEYYDLNVTPNVEEIDITSTQTLPKTGQPATLSNINSNRQYDVAITLTL